MTTDKHANLVAAKKAKNDEFYTQWHDVANEMNGYHEHDPDVFKDKTILLPCDDPERSQFTRYFVHNFERLGIRKLISTSYAQEADTATGPARGRILTLERGQDRDNPRWGYLEGRGDFRSEEVTALRDEADMVISNPPFSKFLPFMDWIVTQRGLQYAVVGNMNSVTCSEIFPLFKDGLLWYGPTSRSGGFEFQVPDDYPATAASHRVDGDGRKLVRVNARWFTNIEHGRRPEPLQLMTMAENKRHSRRKKIRAQGYPTYDNYDAVEVGFTEAIPSDYRGAMGVPISFLDKHNPQQFEILGVSEQDLNGGSGGLWDRASGVRHPLVAGARTYTRIFIRHT